MIENFIKHIENKKDSFVIFDIGSRDCIQSIEFYQHFPNSKIYAFECNPNTLDICKKNIEPYLDRITLIEGAVCDYDGYITFYPINKEKTITTWKDGNPGASSLFKSNGEYKVETYVQDEIITQCHRLDSVMNKYGISHVDIIWMDLQGAELLALKGLGNYLKDVKFIHTEVCHRPIYTNQALFEDINEYLVNFYSFKLLSKINLDHYYEDVIYENIFHKHPLFDKIHLTYDEQTFVRGKPLEYILHTINLFKKYTHGKTILEIGSIRAQMAHHINTFNPICCNDGHSTYFWKKYTDADIYTVDIDSNCKKIINNDINLVGVKSFTDDAINFANTFDKKIDLLFLDAWDVFDGSPYAEKHLEIYNILKDKLSKNCLILIDDTDICSGGKGRLLIPVLIQDGFKCIFNRRQTLFIRYDKHEDIDYSNIIPSINNVFDIVIPVGPYDKDVIYKQIEYTKKNIIGYRNIYLICYDPNIIIDGCVMIDEKTFPFSLKTVSDFHGQSDRNGWYLQQLLKLYALIIIPDILDRCLIIDSDTFFLKPTTFINNNKCLYNFGTEYHADYFVHMSRLHEDFVKVYSNISGICHHMMFEKKYILEIINKIEEKHNDKFYNVFLKMITGNTGSGASEYEIYFNYMLKYHNNNIEIRKLNWKNDTSIEDVSSEYDYISHHWFLR